MIRFNLVNFVSLFCSMVGYALQFTDLCSAIFNMALHVFFNLSGIANVPEICSLYLV